MTTIFEELFNQNKNTPSGPQSSLSSAVTSDPNGSVRGSLTKPTGFSKESSKTNNKFFTQIQSLLGQIQSPSNVPYDFSAQAPAIVEGLNSLLNYQPSQDANLQAGLEVIRRQAEQGYNENTLPQLTTNAFNSGAIDNGRYDLEQSNANRDLQTNIADVQTKALYNAESNNRQRIAELLNNSSAIYTGAANLPLVQASAQDEAANFEVYNLLSRLQPLLAAGSETTTKSNSGSKNTLDPSVLLKILGI